MEDTGQVLDLKTYNIWDQETYDFEDILKAKVMIVVENFKKQLCLQSDHNKEAYDNDTLTTSCQLPDMIDNTLHISSDIPALQATGETLEIQDQTTSISNTDQQFAADNASTEDNNQKTATLSTPSNQDESESYAGLVKYFNKLFKNYPQHQSIMKDKIEIANSQFGKLWDFGGQAMYHITHHPFMSGNSIYILVFNIAQDIDQPVIQRDGQEANYTYIQSIQEWLTSTIGSYSGNDDITVRFDGVDETYSLPIIILIGTHGDLIDSVDEQKRRFDLYERTMVRYLPSFKSHICSSGIIFNCNANDINSTVDSERQQCCQKLHHIIQQFVSHLPFMKRSIPVRWYIMATLLHSCDDDTNSTTQSSNETDIAIKISNIMSVDQIRELAIDCGLYDNDTNLHDMLLYLHDTGEILYCQRGGLQQMVVTNLDWLINIFRAIIKLDLNDIKSATVREYYVLARTTGKMAGKCVDYAIAQFNLKANEIEFILKLLQSYNIICPMEDNQYLVPYLLQTVTQQFDISDYQISEWLYIGYDHQVISYIPDGIFHCLVAACYQTWQFPQVELAYQSAKFCLRDDHHHVIIKKERSFIALQYCYQYDQDSEVAKWIVDNVEVSIAEKCPHVIIKDLLSNIVQERLPKFKHATPYYSVTCTKCSQQTDITSHAPTNPILIQCSQCNGFFKSQALKDWKFDAQNQVEGK